MYLEEIGQLLAPVRVRLYDPADLKVREMRAAPVAEDAPLSIALDPESLVAARVEQRMAAVLSVSHQEVSEQLEDLAHPWRAHPSFPDPDPRLLRPDRRAQRAGPAMTLRNHRLQVLPIDQAHRHRAFLHPRGGVRSTPEKDTAS